MAKFQFNETLDQLAQIVTARVADGTGSNNQLADADVGKFVKLAGDSRYGLCAVGDEIEGVLDSINGGPTQDGYTLGGVRKNGRVKVTLDGLQATAGTGTIAIGDYVVAGTPVARGTALSGAYPQVCKATAAATGLVQLWRVVALYGTGAVGQIALIERV
jgi:hypothetical protein